MGFPVEDIYKLKNIDYIKMLSHMNTHQKNCFSLFRHDLSINYGGRRDMLTGRRRNKAHKISFSNKKSRKWQEVNIQRKNYIGMLVNVSFNFVYRHVQFVQLIEKGWTL